MSFILSSLHAALLNFVLTHRFTLSRRGRASASQPNALGSDPFAGEQFNLPGFYRGDRFMASNWMDHPGGSGRSKCRASRVCSPVRHVNVRVQMPKSCFGKPPNKPSNSTPYLVWIPQVFADRKSKFSLIAKDGLLISVKAGA